MVIWYNNFHEINIFTFSFSKSYLRYNISPVRYRYLNLTLPNSQTKKSHTLVQIPNLTILNLQLNTNLLNF